MRRCLAAVAVLVLGLVGWTPAAFACGGLVAPNGAVKLLQTTTLVTYHAGVEHYITSFEYAGGGAKFGSIIPLPGVPTAVTKGGSWTLQRLEREVNPPPPVEFAGALASSAGASAGVSVVLRTQVDALDITVVKGGGPAVTAWVRQQGFTVSRDLPAMLDFYARRSPVFLTATFDPVREASRGLNTGDGTPVQITIPTANPWVPLHILSLAKDADDPVTADVFLLTDRTPAILTGPGVRVAQSRPAEAGLLTDLRSDQHMGWIPQSAWFSYLKVNSPATKLSYDMAVDASGAGHPSPIAAALTSVLTSKPGPGSGSIFVWAGLAALTVVLVGLGAAGYRDQKGRPTAEP